MQRTTQNLDRGEHVHVILYRILVFRNSLHLAELWGYGLTLTPNMMRFCPVTMCKNTGLLIVDQVNLSE